MCLESGYGSGTFCKWRQRAPDSWCHDAEYIGLKTDLWSRTHATPQYFHQHIMYSIYTFNMTLSGVSPHWAKSTKVSSPWTNRHQQGNRCYILPGGIFSYLLNVSSLQQKRVPVNASRDTETACEAEMFLVSADISYNTYCKCNKWQSSVIL